MTKISDLTAASVALGTEQIPYRLGGVNGRLTAQQIANLGAGGYINVKDPTYGATGDGVTNDYAAIVLARTAAMAAGKSLAFPDGTYCIGSTLELGYEKLKVIALGGKVTIKHTGTGVGVSFNGMTNYPGSQGCAGGVFGGPNRFLLEGNANTTNLVLVDNWHFGDMSFAGKNATNAILLCQDSGISGASAVETTFDVQISTNASGVFTTIPWYGIRATSLAACIFNKIFVESVGNVASSTPGVSLVSCIGNLFLGGTVESCLAGGMAVGTGCSRNVFQSLDVEVNGTQQDWTITGNNNILIGCSGGGTTSGQYLSGDNNLFIGGNFQSMGIQATADGNEFQNCTFITAFTDIGTNTSVRNCTGASDKLFIANIRVTGVAGAGYLDLTNQSSAAGANATGLRLYADASNNLRVANSSGFISTFGTSANTASRTYTFPDVTGTITMLDATQALTNKTLTSPVITTPTGIVKGDVGLGNVDNTSDVNKPVSTAQQTALNLKFDIASATAAVRTFLGTPSSANLAAAVTDEDGTGVLPFEATGTWTPTDQSGAALTFSAVACRYTKIGNMIHAYGVFTFPSTANAATILIGGLPFTVPNQSYAAIPSAIKNAVGVNGAVAMPVINSSNFNIFKNGTNANAINSDLTTSVVTVNITYPAT